MLSHHHDQGTILGARTPTAIKTKIPALLDTGRNNSIERDGQRMQKKELTQKEGRESCAREQVHHPVTEVCLQAEIRKVPRR